MEGGGHTTSVRQVRGGEEKEKMGVRNCVCVCVCGGGEDKTLVGNTTYHSIMIGLVETCLWKLCTTIGIIIAQYIDLIVRLVPRPPPNRTQRQVLRKAERTWDKVV